MAKRTIEFQGKTFVLENEHKIERAIFGSPTTKGLVGGVGQSADDKTLLAEYDRLGGLITLNGKKVATGTFYDFRSAHAKAEKDVVVGIVKKPKARNQVEKSGDSDEDEDGDVDEEVDEDSEDDEEVDESDADSDEDEEEKPKKAKK